uniref:Dynamin-like protein n=1 Tax=Panagrolaimus davidi TaxID=227884 RepID=A0A914QUN0_9BILA
MESLISVISDLRKISNNVGLSQLELPQIIVVGSQSSGKSSVLEGIVGWDFLPRGTEMVTRRPLVLNLVNMPENDRRRQQTGLTGDWATFEHLPIRRFTNFEEVRKEIEDDTFNVVGNDKNVSPIPIHLTIYSSKVIDLTLVDLPGIVRVPIENQPPTIAEDIMQIIHEYIKSPKSLILAVTPANQDIATSDGLDLARTYDPEGNRTLCVLTKLDEMGRGTNALRMLTGQTIPLLINHIAENLPELRAGVDNMFIDQQATLENYGEAAVVVDHSRITTQIIRKFADLFKELIMGYDDLDTTQLTGGAIIGKEFRNFSYFDHIIPDEGLTRSAVITAMRNAHGSRVSLFVPEHALEVLAKHQNKRLREPSINFVDTIKAELLQIVGYCTNKIIEEEGNRFPRLYARLNTVASDIVNARLQPTKDFVKKIVDLQLHYNNFKHPEFKEELDEETKKKIANYNATASLSFTEDKKENANSAVSEGFHSESSSLSSQNSDKFTLDEIRNSIVLRYYVIQYYIIVRNSLQDLLPKAIMMELVNYVKENIQEELEEIIKKSDDVEQLTKENEAITERREEIKEKLEELKHAKMILENIAELKV